MSLFLIRTIDRYMPYVAKAWVQVSNMDTNPSVRLALYKFIGYKDMHIKYSLFRHKHQDV